MVVSRVRSALAGCRGPLECRSCVSAIRGQVCQSFGADDLASFFGLTVSVCGVFCIGKGFWYVCMIELFFQRNHM